MRIALRRVDDAEQRVCSALDRAQIAWHRCEPTRATVEDAFVSMVREDDAQRSAAQTGGRA
jgi:hypothetical protein